MAMSTNIRSIACAALLLSGACDSSATPADAGGALDLLGADPITVACAGLFAARVAYEKECFHYAVEPPDALSTVATCVGIATLPGALLSAADIDACRARLATLECERTARYPTCFGSWGGNLLAPDHERK